MFGSMALLVQPSPGSLSVWALAVGWDVLAGQLLLAAMGLLGIAVLRRFVPILNMLELVAYGIPLGVVGVSLIALAVACGVGLSTLLVVSLGSVSCIGAAVLWPWPATKTWLQTVTVQREQLLSSSTWLLPALVIGAFAARWAVLWLGALSYEPDGLWAGHINIWGDWPQHLGDVASFVYSNNLPPRHPRFSEHAYGYHYLSAFTAALLVKLGLSSTAALALGSFWFSVLIALGLYAFARRLTLSAGAATLALLLFVLGGSLGWITTVAAMEQTHSIWGTLLQQPWDRARLGEANFRWENIYFAFVVSQRGYLYGLPLGLLIFTLLLEAVQTGARRWFLLAGCVAGLLPLAHLSTLLPLALITPWLVVLFPRRAWLWFFLAWILIAGPQLYVQQGGERGATAALRAQLGWVAAPDAWPWFWLKNLGWFVPLLVFALLDRQLLAPVARRFLWGFMPVFVLANLVVFQPWDWDNHKILVYWFWAVCLLVAGLLAKLWSQNRTVAGRALIAAVVLSMILSGVLINVQQLLGQDRYRLASTEELALAELVLAQTPPRAVFLVGLNVDHPIPTLTGRPIVLGFPGWLWTHGIDYAQQERDVRAMYAFTPSAPALLAKYDVSYVVVGPGEREQFEVNLQAFRDRFPAIITTEHYQVFAVKAAP